MKTSYFARINSKKFNHLKDKGIQISRSARYWQGAKYPPSISNLGFDKS